MMMMRRRRPQQKPYMAERLEEELIHLQVKLRKPYGATQENFQRKAEVERRLAAFLSATTMVVQTSAPSQLALSAAA